jgi:hypothetical protein
MSSSTDYDGISLHLQQFYVARAWQDMLLSPEYLTLAIGFALPFPRVIGISMDISTAATMGKPRACLSEIRMSTAKCDLCFGHGRGCAHKRIDEHEDARGNWPATPARLRDLQVTVVTGST